MISALALCLVAEVVLGAYQCQYFSCHVPDCDGHEEGRYWSECVSPFRTARQAGCRQNAWAQRQVCNLLEARYLCCPDTEQLEPAYNCSSSACEVPSCEVVQRQNGDRAYWSGCVSASGRPNCRQKAYSRREICGVEANFSLYYKYLCCPDLKAMNLKLDDDDDDDDD